MLPDRPQPHSIDDDKFVRERLYSDEKLHISDGSDGKSPKQKPHSESVSSNPDLDDEFAFNQGWGGARKAGTMLPPSEINRQADKIGAAKKGSVQRLVRRS